MIDTADKILVADSFGRSRSHLKLIFALNIEPKGLFPNSVEKFVKIVFEVVRALGAVVGQEKKFVVASIKIKKIRQKFIFEMLKRIFGCQIFAFLI